MTTGHSETNRPEATACAVCHRAVWTTDVDTAGRCVFCQPVSQADGAASPSPSPEKLA